jgi:hypothetical protein
LQTASSNASSNSQVLETKISIVNPRNGSGLNYLWITLLTFTFLDIAGLAIQGVKKRN